MRKPIIETINDPSTSVTLAGDLTLRGSRTEQHPDVITVEAPYRTEYGTTYTQPVATFVLYNTEDLPERLEAMAKVLTDHAAAIRVARAAAAAEEAAEEAEVGALREKLSGEPSA